MDQKAPLSHHDWINLYLSTQLRQLRLGLLVSTRQDRSNKLEHRRYTTSAQMKYNFVSLFFSSFQCLSINWKREWKKITTTTTTTRKRDVVTKVTYDPSEESHLVEVESRRRRLSEISWPVRRDRARSRGKEHTRCAHCIHRYRIHDQRPRVNEHVPLSRDQTTIKRKQTKWKTSKKDQCPIGRKEGKKEIYIYFFSFLRRGEMSNKKCVVWYGAVVVVRSHFNHKNRPPLDRNTKV